MHGKNRLLEEPRVHVYAIDSVAHLNVVVQWFKNYVYIPTIESSSMKTLCQNLTWISVINNGVKFSVT